MHARKPVCTLLLLLLQGRRRQEGLVAKLLRAELDAAALDKLNAAVGMVQRNNLPYTDADVEQQQQLWMEGLLENDQVGRGASSCWSRES
jgi:hypothetical protein